MPEFRPARASPPIRPVALLAKSLTSTVVSGDVSQSSALSVPELTNLLPEDVELIDAVMARAGPSATTFLAVFKAYNDILQERNLDPNEVVYYGKLLKLGTLKGKNWGQKWNYVKSQNGFGGQAVPSVRRAQLTVPRGPIPAREEDSMTMFSKFRDSEAEPISETEFSGLDEPEYHRAPQQIYQATSISQSSTFQTTTDTDVIHSKRYPILAPPLASKPTYLSSRLASQQRGAPYLEKSGEALSTSTTPPSYRTATHETPRQSYQSRVSSSLTSVEGEDDRITRARQAIAHARQQRRSVVNDEEAWRKIEMQRDEEEADNFRNDKVLERCWEIWKQEYQWIMTTHEQISEARDKIILRMSLQKWRARNAARRELHEKVAKLADKRVIRRALNTWKAKLRAQRQNQWRQNMRMKMKIVRDMHAAQLKKDAWSRWRQSHLQHQSSQHYSVTLLARFLNKWRQKLVDLDQRDRLADDFARTLDSNLINKCWLRWKESTQVCHAERLVHERVSLRILGNAMDVWKKRMHENGTADAYYDSFLLKRAIGSWKSAQDRIRALESRAEKHVARQDDVLLRAVARVWKARERGKLLERVKTLRILKSAWSAWHNAIIRHREREFSALDFSRRSRSHCAISAFRQWTQVWQTHKNAQLFAVQYHSAQLGYKMFSAWQIKHRNQMRLVKQAKSVEKYLVVRRALKRWEDKLIQKRREEKFKRFEVAKLRQIFNAWEKGAQRARHCRVAEEAVQALVNQRIMSSALNRWTNRVIDIKLRELEVSQRRDVAVMSSAFKKWKDICIRHVGELNLMESYRFVKREECMKRTFHRWLAAARKTRHRRLTLQKKEQQMTLGIMSVAWDKWRDRFVEQQLCSVEHNVALQTQRNLLFRSFGIWHAKTKSLPAIRFHASHTKAKYWEIWRAAMPHALLARTAREKDNRTVLVKYLDKWVQVYRTKMALKAVARARYLRLPTATPRLAANARPQPNSTAPAVNPKHVLQDDADVNDNKGWPITNSPWNPSNGRTTRLSLLSNDSGQKDSPTSRNRFTRARSRHPFPSPSRSSVGGGSELLELLETKESGASRPRTRPPSSVGGGEPGKNKLWQELQQIQRRSRSRPSSARSRSPAPP